jgi:hypothetical protein
MVPTQNCIASGYKRTLSKLFVACYEQATENLFNQGNTMSDQSIEDASYQTLRGSTAFIRGQVEVEQHFKQLEQYEGRKALEEFALMVWQAARQSSQSEPVAPTADYVAYLYRDGNKLKVLETWPPDNDAFPVFTTNIRFIDVARLVLDDNVDLILEHGGVKLWETLVTKVNKDYAEKNHE